MLSSWGKSDGAGRSKDGSGEDARKDQDRQEYDWYNEWQKRHAESLKHFEEFKKMVDHDPFGAIFGRREFNRKEQQSTKAASRTASNDANRPAQRSANVGAKTSETKRAKLSPDQPLSSEITSGSDNSNDFIIDPITMRKIFKKQSPPPLQAAPSKDGPSTRSKPFDIPVKPYRAPRESPGAVEYKDNVHPAIRKLETGGQNWLVQEGFNTAPRSSDTAKTQAPYTEGQIAGVLKLSLHKPNFERPRKTPLSTPSKIETALERQSRKARCAAAEIKKDRPGLTYDPEDTKTEDIDLLTASDIRASAGRVRMTQETPQQKQERRKALESDYEKRPDYLEKQLESEIAANNERSEVELMQELESIAKDVRKRDAAKSAHEQEINAQKAAMEAHEAGRSRIEQTDVKASGQSIQPGEGDMASNVHEFASRGRWYKQKAPHASSGAEHRLQKASKDRALVREIRDIYEDSYGTIDTSHRQQTAKQLENASDYPADAYPGTLYEQPWSANVLNDHPETDSQAIAPAIQKSGPLDQHQTQDFQGLSLIGKLFSELRENQTLLQNYQSELRKIPTEDESNNLFQRLKAHEQRLMHTLKAAQSLIKDAATISSNTKTGAASEIAPSVKEEPASIPTTPVKQDLTSEEARPASSIVYKILAYDPSTKKVSTTKTSTLAEPLSEKSLSFSEALSGLENPAKFLPHFAALQNAEYEIAAGGPNFLVFKKSHQISARAELEEPTLEACEPSSDAPIRYANPIDGTTTQTGNFASPTGFVNYDLPYPMDEPLADPPPAPKAQSWKSKPRDKIRRQEDVFSGSSRRPSQSPHEHHRIKAKTKHRRSTRRRRTFKRMFLVGLLTAGGCYAVGAASEFLRM